MNVPPKGYLHLYPLSYKYSEYSKRGFAEVIRLRVS